MTESRTPICDLIELLLSRGTVPGDAIEAARLIELANTRARGSTDAERERWRLKKARQRARKGGLSTGDKIGPLLSNRTVDSDSKERKKKKVGGHVPGGHEVPLDDWPDDYVDQFWIAFPPYRRQAKAKVSAKLARIREQKVTWGTLYGGVLKFAATEPGEYAPAPMVWLNDGRWDREYGRQKGGSNGKATNALGGFSGLGARLRQSVADEERDPGNPPAGDKPAYRR
jgi:hypothetical protein